MIVLLRTARIVMRACAAVLVVLGILFWTGHELALVPAHAAVGLLFVVAMWAIAIAGAAKGAPRSLTVLTVVWGFVVFWLGMHQATILPTSAHWIVEVLHLLVGLAGVGIAERVAGSALRVQPAEA